MRCPYCNQDNTRVVDSRPVEETNSIRRRRLCDSCGRRFTTYENVEIIPLTVIKKNLNREQYDRNKLINGIRRACYKRPIASEKLEAMIDAVEGDIFDTEEKEISITELLPRRSELFRPAVANIDQAVIVFACREPEPNFNLLDRFLVLMEKRNVQVILCFTKADLATAEFKKEVQMIRE